MKTHVHQSGRSHAGAVMRAPLQTIFGPGSIAALPRLAGELGRRPFVCVDGFLREQAFFVQLLDELAAAGLPAQAFSDFTPELPKDCVARAVAAAAEHEPDVIIGLGGGSAMDLAKLVALGLAVPGDVSDYYGENQVPHAVLPVIAVPTTAGTGSEVTPVAVIADPDRELKVGISSPYLIPAVAIVDPDLTVSCPAGVTAHSGIDALCHAVESLSARSSALSPQRPLPVFVGANPLSAVHSQQAISLISAWLPQAVHHGDDMEARSAMSLGSLMAGIAFGSAGTHLAHAVQYPVGALTKTPHGLGVGLMLPYVMEACLPFATPQLAHAADAMGCTDAGASEAERAARGIAFVVRLRESIGIPHTLADIGVREADLGPIVASAQTVRRLVDNGPGPDPAALVEGVVRAAWSGASDLANPTPSD